MTARTYRIAIVVLLLVIAAMVYKFVVSGSTAPAEDGRVAVILAPAERALVLREMRSFVDGIQRMTDALSRDDMKAVATAARSMGIEKAHDAPLSMVAKLPLAFKTLAFGTHREFDTIAADAEAIGKPAHTLAQLSAVLQKCVACHAGYQLRTETAK
ncbi:MAG: hypothetical protein IT521_06115 [Burkholderiales bacterium]|nr:hypothetical protein [Burkholderiales bacterium]